MARKEVVPRNAGAVVTLRCEGCKQLFPEKELKDGLCQPCKKDAREATEGRPKPEPQAPVTEFPIEAGGVWPEKLADEGPVLCPEIVRLTAAMLIEENHPDLEGVMIGYVFKPKATVSNGVQRLGQASKLSPAMSLLTGLDFLITLGYDVWVRLTDRQRLALLDHELTHCTVDSETKHPVMRRHDVEEFNEILVRHGLWYAAVERMGGIVRQLELPLEVPAK